MLKKSALTLLLALSLQTSYAIKLDPQIAQSADKGVAAIYNLDFDTARYHINKLLEQDPNYPIALFGQTMIEWSRFEYEFEKSNPQQAKVFEDSIYSSIKGIEQWMKDNTPDAQSYLALGGVYGVKGRFELANRSFVKAYFSGKKGIKYMNKAAKLDPEMYDALLGEGVYQYYAGTLPAIIKILAKLVASGDADKGIEYLNIVKDKGRFSADTAKLLLVEISIESEKYRNPPLAAKYIAEIVQKYPQNPLYRFVSIIADYENGNHDQVIVKANEFLGKIGTEKFYSDIYTARSYTAIGTAYMAKKDYPKARAAFEASLKATKKQAPSRWQTWNKLRLAQVYDLLGERNKAVDMYRSIIKMPESWGIDEVARQYVKHPYIEQPLGRMSPP